MGNWADPIVLNTFLLSFNLPQNMPFLENTTHPKRKNTLKDDDILEEVKSRLRRLDVGQVIVGLCIIGLSVWCIINVEQIMHKYYSFETIISLQNDPPNRTGFPGVTICAPSIIRPQDLSKLSPRFNRYYRWFIGKIKSFKSEKFVIEGIPIDIDMSVNTEIFITTLSANNTRVFRKYESQILEKYNASDIISKYSVRLEDLISDCKFHPVNIRSFQKSSESHRMGTKNCQAIKPVLESIYEGQKCFTFFSDLFDVSKSMPTDVQMENLPNSGDCDKSNRFCDPQEFLRDSHDQMVFDLNPSIEVRIKAIDNDIWKAFVNGPILMTGK